MQKQSEYKEKKTMNEKKTKIFIEEITKIAEKNDMSFGELSHALFEEKRHFEKKKSETKIRATRCN